MANETSKRMSCRRSSLFLLLRPVRRYPALQLRAELLRSLRPRRTSLTFKESRLLRSIRCSGSDDGKKEDTDARARLRKSVALHKTVVTREKTRFLQEVAELPRSRVRRTAKMIHSTNLKNIRDDCNKLSLSSRPACRLM